MRNLHFYMENPFKAKGISVAELMAFATDDLQRMIANNPGGIFTARIAALQAAINLMLSCMTDDQTKLNVRMAMKQIKKAFRDALPANISKLYVGVQSFYGLQAPQLTIIFGSGRTAFKEATDDCLEALLQTLSTQMTARVADLGATAVANAAALLTSWQTIYGDSEESTGEKTVSQAEKKAAREGVQLELYKNLATLMLNFPDQPDMLDVYMTQSLLEDHSAVLPAKAVITSLTSPSDGEALLGMEAENALTFKVLVKIPGATEFSELAVDLPGPEYLATGFEVGGNYEFIVVGVNSNGPGEPSDPQTVAITKP